MNDRDWMAKLLAGEVLVKGVRQVRLGNDGMIEGRVKVGQHRVSHWMALDSDDMGDFRTWESHAEV